MGGCCTGARRHSSTATPSHAASQVCVALSAVLQVQPWIVRAIGSKLIEGKIDQVASTVVISHCHHRTFTSREWQGLGQQLAALKEALQGANDMLLGGSGRGAAGSRAAAQAVH